MATRIRVGQIDGAGAKSILVRDAGTVGDVSGKSLPDAGMILIGNGGTGFNAAVLSGDFQMAANGDVTIQPDAVETIMIANNTVDIQSDLAQVSGLRVLARYSGPDADLD